MKPSPLLALACLALLAGCSTVSVNVTKPDGTSVNVSRTALLQDLDGEYTSETTHLKLKSNPNVEAMKAGFEMAKGLKP